MVKKKRKVELRRLNWDAVFYADIINGNGFVVTEPAEITIDGKREKSMNGVQSPRFGTNYDDEQSVAERYRCKCGTFKSKLFEGEICPFCKHPVESREADINLTAWISLGDNKIINPYYYNILKQSIGKQAFPDIIYAKYKITTDGRMEKPKTSDFDDNPSSPFAGIGIDAFYMNYENIIAYFMNKKKNKTKTFQLLLKQKRHVFTSHIPISSTLIRPQSNTTDSFYYCSIDKIINTLYTLSENIKNCEFIEKPYIIQRIQTKVNNMWDNYFNELNGKEGLIRGEMLGGSLNYTSRNVIIPDPTLRDNEIDISYHTFLEVFKYKIIYYIMKLDDISLAKANAIWNEASTFSVKVYDIMQYIIKHEDVRLLINRNPTLNFYSMLLMKVRQVKFDGNDYALSVPLSILPGLNADFDGDILNIIGMVDKSLSFMFRKFDPIRRMIISRDTGLLNEYFSITKGQLIDLYYFCTIGEMENDQPETYPVRDNISNEIIYVEKSVVKNYTSGIIDAYMEEMIYND